MKIMLITQARIASTRLPGKVLLPLGSGTILHMHLNRLRRCQRVDIFMVATTNEPDSGKILGVAQSCGFQYYQGSVDDVLDRFYQAAKPFNPDCVVRVTSDCPLIDPGLVDDLVEKFLAADVDYASNCLQPNLPDGMDCEVFRFSVLERAWREAKLDSEREHVTPYIWKNSNLKGGQIFSALAVEYGQNRSHIRLTIDQSEDYAVLKNLVERCGERASLDEYVKAYPEYARINSHIKTNEGYETSLKKDRLP